MDALLGTMRQLPTAAERDARIAQILQALIERLRVRSGGFWLRDPASNTLELLSAVGDGPDREKVRDWLASSAAESVTPDLLDLALIQGEEHLGSFLFPRPPGPRSVREDFLSERALAQEAVPIILLTRLAEQARQAAAREERSRLAMEIHDTLAQYFAAILLQIGVAERIAPREPAEAWRLIAQAGQLARTAAEEARRSIWSLQPDAETYGDLSRTLARAVRETAAGAPESVEMHVYGDRRPLTPDIGMNLLRIGQEAVNNALRHARASRIRVELTYEATRVRLCVRDDGRGFDPQDEAERERYGLAGMRQRAERIGADLTVNGEPGRGTAVTVSVESVPAPGFAASPDAPSEEK